MPVRETYSKRRKKAERAGQADVYQYDEMPNAFRVQVLRICIDTIGVPNRYESWGIANEPESNQTWRTLEEIVSRELGLFGLGKNGGDSFTACQKHFLATDTDGVLDIIEIAFHIIDTHVRDKYNYEDRMQCQVKQLPDDAIDELNHRFREHGIGYQFEGGEIIRVDSQYLHAEAVKPAISLLQCAGFEGALDEFMAAHKFYRDGDNKEAIGNASKAFESVMKVICAQRGWTPPANPQARHLIETIITNGLISQEMMAFFNGLRPVLESGLPTLRNRTSSHGQGQTPVVIPEYLAAYALHMAAANIVMLVEAHKAMP